MAVKNFFKSVNKMKEYAYEERDVELGRYLLKLVDYLKAGEYTSYRKIKDLVHWSWEGYSDKFIADSLCITESTLRVNSRTVSNDLYRIFGDDFFDLLKDFSTNKQELENRLELAKKLRNKAVNYIIRDVLEKVEDIDNLDLKGIKSYDCKEEIKFLQKYNLEELISTLNKLDLRKIAYLRNVLNGVSGTMDERYYLLDLMSKGTEEE